MKALVNIPFLRITLPFVAGILIQLRYDPEPPNCWWLSFTVGTATVIAFMPKSNKAYKMVFLLSADFFFLMAGMHLTRRQDLAYQPDYYGNMTGTDSALYMVVATTERPIEKGRYLKCEVTVREVKKGGVYLPVRGQLIAYFAKDSLIRPPRAGEALLIRARLLDLRGPANPNEFDYKAYLYNKQIYHTAFVANGAFQRLYQPGLLHPVTEFGLRIKGRLLDALGNSGLNATASGICSALLTGYDAEVDKSVTEAFSHSGTLHVLSVSGLHTGLIYLVLNFLFNLLDRANRFRLSRFALISLILWTFALITGFSAPVLRSVIMFNLLGFGKIYFRHKTENQMNILLVSAFALLLYNPFYIADVGFLLSYTALGGIIYFQPRLHARWRPSNKLVDYCWQSITASFAATLATLPITLFYFKQFPIWFSICNLVVVPLSFCLLLLGFLVILKMGFLGPVINGLVAFMLWFMGLFNSQKYGYIDGIDFGITDVFFLTALVVLASHALSARSYKALIITMSTLLLWQVSSLLNSHSAKTSSLFTVYNIKNRHVFSLKNKRDVHINNADSTFYSYSVKPQMVSFNHPEIHVGAYNFTALKGQKLLILNKPGYFPKVSVGDITILVIGNDYQILESELAMFTGLKVVVADASNTISVLRKTEDLCRKFDLVFYSTKYKGAFLKLLQ